MTAGELWKLRKTGFVPDMICTTAAMGNSLFLRDIFPESFCVVHAETFSRRDDGLEGVQKAAPARRRIRNVLHLNSLADCDLAVTSTRYQRDQFPEWLAKDMVVLPRCVDTDFFSPGSGREAFGELVAFSGQELASPGAFRYSISCRDCLPNAQPAGRRFLPLSLGGRSFPPYVSSLPGNWESTPSVFFCVAFLRRKHIGMC